MRCRRYSAEACMPSLGSTARARLAGRRRERLGLAAGARRARARRRGSRTGRSATAPAPSRASATTPSVDAQRAGDGAHGVVAVARRDLGEARRPSPAPVDREAHLRHDLVGLEAARQVRDEELVRGHERATPDGPVTSTVARQRLQQQRQLGRGVGVRDRAADGAAVARRDVPDVGQRERAAAGSAASAARVALEVALRAERADAHVRRRRPRCRASPASWLRSTSTAGRGQAGS